MKAERKAAARLHARIDALDRVAEQLRKAWLALDQHRGLESLAEPVEDAVDAVEQALQAAQEELDAREGDRLTERESGGVWTP